MNKQQTFNKVVRHLRKQGRAMSDNGGCWYREPDTGKSCAVGCLIPDDVYDKTMEGFAIIKNGSTYDGRMNTLVRDVLGLDLLLLSDLQHVHDARQMDLEFGFECVADRHGLRMPECTR